MVIIIKKCSVCGIEKELNEFYNQKKTRKDGINYIYYQPYCKECAKKRSSKWEKDNPEKRRVLKKRYDDKPDQRKRLYNVNKKRLENGKYKEWQQNNPDKAKKNNQYRHIHKKHKISNMEWEECKKYFNHRCAYCGLAIEDHYIKFRGKVQLGDLHKEHVDHEGSNDLSNCIPSCKNCNSSKHTSTLDEWYSPLNEFCNVYSEERLHRIVNWLNEDYKKYIKVK